MQLTLPDVKMTPEVQKWLDDVNSKIELDPHFWEDFTFMIMTQGTAPVRVVEHKGNIKISLDKYWNKHYT